MENLIYRGEREPENVGKKSSRVSEEFRNLRFLGFQIISAFSNYKIM